MTTTSNTNNKTTNNDVEVNEQVLKALKIAAIAIKDGIKEVCQIAVSSIKSNQQNEGINKLSEYVKNIKESAKEMNVKESAKEISTRSSSPQISSHVSSRLASPHITSSPSQSQSQPVSCVYCYGQHWVAYCNKIPNEFKGYCVKCWTLKSHQAKNCKYNARKEPWL
ncbi:unnamed protein product [Rhizophagus irregularis]|nr:unnamed protein product [Rhizophagus irregularis]